MNDADLSPSAHPLRQTLLGSLRGMLRPVVQQLIRWGVPYAAFDQLVRTLYVEVAENEFALPFKRPTDSRVTLLTGLNRKEVARIRGVKGARRAARPTRLEESAAARVIGRWLIAPYSDAAGKPRVLPYEAAARKPSFTQIVRQLSVDAPPRSVLDELLRMELVELRAGGQIAMREQALIPKDDPSAKLQLLGSDPAELFATIAHNIERPDEAWLQRKVIYDNVGATALPELRGAARELGVELIQRANALLASRDRDRNFDAPGGDRSVVSIGVYYFESQYRAEHGGDDTTSAGATSAARAKRTAARTGRKGKR